MLRRRLKKRFMDNYPIEFPTDFMYPAMEPHTAGGLVLEQGGYGRVVNQGQTDASPYKTDGGVGLPSGTR